MTETEFLAAASLVMHPRRPVEVTFEDVLAELGELVPMRETYNDASNAIEVLERENEELRNELEDLRT